MPRETYKIGLNTTFFGKPPKSARVNYAKNWVPYHLGVDEFIDHVRAGGGFSAHFLDSYRKTSNFICSDVIAADFDKDVRIEEALELPLVKNHGAFLYTTPSHTDQEHRFRVVFLLDETIGHAGDWADALKGLALKLGSDPSIKDAARMFFGSMDCDVIRIGGTLPSSEVARLIAHARDVRARRHSKARFASGIASSLKLAADQIIETAEGVPVTISDLAPNTSVFCPFHGDDNPSAHVVRSIRGANGIHCMACDATFWTDQGDDYDFAAFDNLVDQRAAADAFNAKPINVPFGQLFPPDPKVSVIQERFLPPILYNPGVTVIKSPKGSGKTEALSALIEFLRSADNRPKSLNKDLPKSVLLIGHRQSLIKEAANRLKLDCYLDDDATGRHRDARFGYAICLDSLHKIATPGTAFAWDMTRITIPPSKYDLIILDESEQVISHLLSETLRERKGMTEPFAWLEFMIRNAKAVYALDADLGLITLHALKELRPADWQERLHIIHNKPVEVSARRPMTIYKSRKMLQNRMIQALRDGKRCFIASNSKNTINVLDTLLRKELGSKFKIMTITSENSRGKAEVRFVENIQTEILKVQALLCSPSLGTGIDISFPDGKCEIDEVFGFFSPHVNKHTDIDQQLARVRNPGAVSVWFDGGSANYETHLSVIRRQLAAAGFVTSALTGRLDDAGLPEFNENDTLLNIAAHVMVAERSSQNRIQTLFAELRHANGWDIAVVEKPDPATPNKSWKDAQRDVRERRIEGILNAEPIDDTTAYELMDAKGRGAKLAKEDICKLQRYELEQAYNQTVSRMLIERDNGGKLREQMQVYRQIFNVRQELEGWFFELQKEVQSGRALHNNPIWVLCAALLFSAGLMDGPKLLVRKTVRGDDLELFKKTLRTNRVLIEEVFEAPLRRDFESNPVRQLNALIGHAGIKLAPVKRRQVAGTTNVEYRIDNSISAWI